MSNGIQSYTVQELRVETKTDVLYLRRRADVFPEEWKITNMLGRELGEVQIERGYANVYKAGRRVFQNDASALSDRFDDPERQLGMLTYIAENFTSF